MFDKIGIQVRAGDGGDGAVSFRREKYVPFGGPDGGDGGDGGDVLIQSDSSINNLRFFAHDKFYRADKGGNGRGSQRSGKKGADLVLRVPAGTIVWDAAEESGGFPLADLERSGQQAIVARGGRGGAGNTRFASSTNQTPRLALKGQAGEEKGLTLEVRLIADVGVIGYPNAGKSTLLTAVSAARPKVASYPFTTLDPVLGVVEVGHRSMLLAEIPGLVDGAHLGRGLGHDFLRHIMRTRILIHLIDGSSSSPVADMTNVNVELSLFDAALAEKPQLVAVNKIDLPEVQTRLDDIRQAFRDVGTPVSFISADSGEGTAELMANTMQVLQQRTAAAMASDKAAETVFRPKPRDTGATVYRAEDTFVIVADVLERIVARVDISDPEVRWQLQGQMDRMGISRELLKAGVEPGDKIRCGDIEWQW